MHINVDLKSTVSLSILLALDMMGLKFLQQNLHHHHRKYHQQLLNRAGALHLLPSCRRLSLLSFSTLPPRPGNCVFLFTNGLGLHTRCDIPGAAISDSMDFFVSRSIGIARLCRILLAVVSNKADSLMYAVHNSLERHSI